MSWIKTCCVLLTFWSTEIICFILRQSDAVKGTKVSDSWVFWGKYLCNTGHDFLYLIIISKYFLIAVFRSFLCNSCLVRFLLGITGFVAQGPVLSKSMLPSPQYFISLGFKVEGGHPHHHHLLEYYVQV